MAKKNRTEILSEVTTKFIPTLTLTTHKSFLDDDLVNSAVYEKDVIDSETPGGGSVVVDYSDKDTATVTTAVNLSVSFTSIENGAVKYLALTKTAVNTISFAGAINVTNFQKYIDNKRTSVTYAIYNKNGVIYATALLETIIEGVKADIDAADAYKFPTAKAVSEAIAAIPAEIPQFVDIAMPAWDMNANEFSPTIALPAVVVTNKARVSGSTVFILEDGLLFGYPLANPLGSLIVEGTWYLDFQGGGQMVVRRLTGGYFDSTSFDSLGQSRGNIRVFFTTV